MHGVLGLDLSITVLVIVVVASVVLLVLIIAAPSRRVRNEPPLDPAVEAKLLLRRNPDEPTGEVPRIASMPDESTDDAEEEFDLSELRDLDGS